MKMGETSTHEASHEDQDAMGQRPGAGGGTLELEAPAEALHLLRQLKILRDDDELPDGFVIDSKRMRNLHLELFEMFNIAIDKAQPLPTGKSNGTRLATAANAIATAIADHLNKSGYHAMGDTQNLHAKRAIEDDKGYKKNLAEFLEKIGKSPRQGGHSMNWGRWRAGGGCGLRSFCHGTSPTWAGSGAALAARGGANGTTAEPLAKSGPLGQRHWPALGQLARWP